MASRALVKAARSPDDYARVYDRILGQVKEPVIIHWLGEMFDPGARRLLGPQGPHAGDGRRGRRHRGQSRQGRRHQDLAARQGQGDRDAPPPAAGRAHVYRRRLQLRRADRGRRAGLFRRAARHLRRDRAGRRRPRSARSRAATPSRSTTSWRRPCRCRATSSRRRPASTRPAWCSWPISTACRTISSWSAARRARARRCISPSCSGCADAAGLLADPDCAAARMRSVMAVARRGGLMRDLSQRPRAARDQFGDGEGLVAAAARRRLRARRHHRDRAVARHRAGLRRRAGRQADPRARARR